MNPLVNETGNLNLPPPVMETLPTTPLPPETSPVQSEQAPAAPERSAGVAQPAVPALPVPLPVNPILTNSPTADPVTAQPLATAPAGGSQKAIEKEYVDRAKRVVQQTHDDPHRQSEELTVVRADYMRQTFNKVIKTK